MTYHAEHRNRLERIVTLGCELRRAVQDDDRDQIERLGGELAGLADMALWSLEKAGGMSQAMALMTSQQHVEWYTPPWVLDLARQVLGPIDLDPASNPTANEWVQAARYYTKDDDGFSKPWAGRVWLNPPFDDTARWAERLAAAHVDGDVTAALFLCNSAPGYKWYERLADVWPGVQFRERMRFVRGDGQVNKDKTGNAKKSQTVFYFGPDADRFFEVFAPYGRRLHGTGAALVAPLWEVSRDAA